ncbi:oxidoreductase [Frondihabitans sp. PAMC 28766]|uniref:SDR family NAD(P)-dependent oxidoreductase n=1 Tax=Frondihabitans sp. PAMC 28766 TaxID=1795630 RepID=UPI00078D8417|nr:SDR family NAD(P)-dependent oxidoreductase [Frondihabitans sp. PAMC 28766]AMM21529.1 oxidoreductase [Frondihabitans sp. PAMC 28766]
MAEGRITSPFGADTTALQVVEAIDLTGRRAIVTGGSSGIGVETARALSAAGAAVTLAVRDPATGHETAADITAATGNPVDVARLDIADLESIEAFVGGWRGALDILVANAGIMALPDLHRTAAGWELQFATNHLGHFHLTTGLHDALAAAGDARVVAVSSVGHIDGGVDFDDLMFERRPYDRWAAYGQSKTANILFGVEGSRRWAADGITINALNPGRIPATGLMRHLGSVPPAAAPGVASSTGVSVKTVEQGAATSVFLAVSPLVEGAGGRYFEDCNEAAPHQPGIRRGVAPYALDPDDAARLWRVSEELVAAARR